MKYQVEQHMLYCPIDENQTLHFRDSRKPNWPLHIILTFLTGFWIIICLIIAINSRNKADWVCSKCGNVNK
jgi:preprotein translocase subunit SecG